MEGGFHRIFFPRPGSSGLLGKVVTEYRQRRNGGIPHLEAKPEKVPGVPLQTVIDRLYQLFVGRQLQEGRSRDPVTQFHHLFLKRKEARGPAAAGIDGTARKLAVEKDLGRVREEEVLVHKEIVD
jgi:hypothetical protein